MNETAGLESLAFSLPEPAYLFGALLFGLVGFAAFRYGRKTGSAAPKWIGLALMLYPYAVAGTWQLYVVGSLLCAALVIWH